MQAVRGIVVIATVLAAVACGGGVEPAVESTTTTVPLDVTAPTNGWVQVGVETFDLVFTCYAAGAGDVVAIGVGTDSGSGQRVE
ncbi:MAG TPA: hypothetical protein QF905_04445, partial [Acidimicrobiales bacterium]|nr:hypothetical protein [Acidimicrobiales bacterium]